MGSKKAFNLDSPQHKQAQVSDETLYIVQVIGTGLPISRDDFSEGNIGYIRVRSMPPHIGRFTQSRKRPLDTCLAKALRPSQQRPTLRRPRKTPLAPVFEGLKVTSGPYTTLYTWLSCHSRLTRFDMYQDLTKLYPEAKEVILSVRDSDDVS